MTLGGFSRFNAQRIHHVLKRLRQRAEGFPPNGSPPTYPKGCALRWASVVTHLNILAPYSEDNQMDVYNNTGEAFCLMWQAIEEAKSTIDWITYICKDDHVGRETIRRLVDAARRGVRVRFLYDDAGNISGRSSLMEPLIQCPTATVTCFHPFLRRMLKYYVKGMEWSASPGIRNHRKILVVDDSVAFCGGLNIGNEYAGTEVGGSGKFRDSLCRVRGPAVQDLVLVVEDTIRAVYYGRQLPDIRSSIQRWVRGPKVHSSTMVSAEYGCMCQVLASNAFHAFSAAR